MSEVIFATLCFCKYDLQYYVLISYFCDSSPPSCCFIVSIVLSPLLQSFIVEDDMQYCVTVTFDVNSFTRFLTNLFIRFIQWRSHGGVRGLQPSPIEPQMTSYIIETVRTKCIISEALKVRDQKYD